MTHFGVAKAAIANTSAAKHNTPPIMTNLSILAEVVNDDFIPLLIKLRIFAPQLFWTAYFGEVSILTISKYQIWLYKSNNNNTKSNFYGF